MIIRGWVVNEWAEYAKKILPVRVNALGHQITYPIVFATKKDFYLFHTIRTKVKPIKIKMTIEEEEE